jgi:hypothetical protein
MPSQFYHKRISNLFRQEKIGRNYVLERADDHQIKPTPKIISIVLGLSITLSMVAFNFVPAVFQIVLVLCSY